MVQHRQTKTHRAAALILALYLALGCVYSIATPVMEASDELRHYPFVQHLAAGGGLPVQQPGVATLWGQEGSQPPLYYALMGALTRWIDASDLSGLMRLNPHAEVGVPLSPANKNQVLHGGAQEAFPWRGAALAVHLIRLASVLLGAGTVLCTYLLARTLLPDRPGIPLAAMAVSAFLPMFLFISASVNNDTLVTLLSSIALLMLVRLVQRGATPGQLVLLGVVIGLACLSKLGALGLLPLAALAIALRAFAPSSEGPAAGGEGARRARLRWAVGAAAMIFLPALAVAGWWYLRNLRLYGDVTGLNAMLEIAGRRPAPPSAARLLAEFQGFRINFWGLFGAVNVLMRPAWIYTLLDALTVAALVGLAVWAATRWRAQRFAAWPALAIPAAWIGILFVGVIRWTSQTMASQGRLMLPAISAIGLFLALGWLGLLSPRGERAGAAVIAGGMFLLAALAPVTAIRPAYPPPESFVAAEGVPADAIPVNLSYGGDARLLAYEMPPGPLNPGQDIDITLYWEALRPMTADHSVYVQLFGWRQGLAQEDSYPGGGAFPTSLWRPGQIIRDRYRLRVSPDAVGPAPAWLTVGMYDFGTMERLPVTDAAGDAVVYPVLGRTAVAAGSASYAPSHSLDANLSGQARLTGYDVSEETVSPGDDWELTLYWEALAPFDRDETVFVHLVDAAGRTIAQTDVQPTGGFHPTSAWTPGQRLKDSYALTIPEDAAAGPVRIVVGLYDASTGERLEVLDAAGNPAGNQAEIGEIALQNH